MSTVVTVTVVAVRMVWCHPWSVGQPIQARLRCPEHRHLSQHHHHHHILNPNHWAQIQPLINQHMGNIDRRVEYRHPPLIRFRMECVSFAFIRHRLRVIMIVAVIVVDHLMLRGVAKGSVRVPVSRFRVRCALRAALPSIVLPWLRIWVLMTS